MLKNWILEKFQNYRKFEWIVRSSKDWRLRPPDCFQTKYELKSIAKKENQVGLSLKNNKYLKTLMFSIQTY